MRNILLLIILFQIQIGLSQNENHYKYDTISYNSQYNRSELLKFDDLKISKAYWNFRLWTNDYVLDLKENKTSLEGRVFMIARELNNENNSNRCFIQSIKLDSNLTLKLKYLITKFNNKNIPTQDSITNWGRGFHGLAYGIEFVNNGLFFHKTYWQPSSFTHIKEAVVVNEFINSVENELNISQIDSVFYANIPFRSYTVDGYKLITSPLSKKEIKANKKGGRKLKRK